MIDMKLFQTVSDIMFLFAIYMSRTWYLNCILLCIVYYYVVFIIIHLSRNIYWHVIADIYVANFHLALYIWQICIFFINFLCVYIKNKILQKLSCLYTHVWYIILPDILWNLYIMYSCNKHKYAFFCHLASHIFLYAVYLNVCNRSMSVVSYKISFIDMLHGNMNSWWK